MIDVDDYQARVTRVKKYKEGQEDLYLLAKLTEETGEVAKEIRKRIDGEPPTKNMTKELGDLLWCLTAIAERNGITLFEVFRQNLIKLEERNLL